MRGTRTAQECHEAVTPEEHYEGQCYACHERENWELDIHFDHTNYMEAGRA